MATTHIGATRLFGLGLTPGKLRGLQRISNPNGTLTMVATDQSSSMIGMIKDSLKKKGEDREPTFAEIAEAKIRAACSTDAVVGAAVVSPCSEAIDVEATPGMPHGSIRSKSARSTVTLSAIPW